MGFSAGTLAAISAVTSVVGGVVQASAAKQQGKSAQALANYNAKIAENDALAARQSAAFEATKLERAGKKFRGTTRAAMAATGGELLDMGDVRDANDEELVLDLLAIKYGGETGYRAGQQRADVSRFEGSVAKQRAGSAATGSLLTGLSSAANTMGKYGGSVAKTKVDSPYDNYGPF